MAVTIDTARRREPRRLIAVVQPHRYSRVQALWRELGDSVTGADVVVVTDVYGAAQEPIPGVTGKLVVDGVQRSAPGRRTVYLPHRRDVVAFLDREVRDGDLVVTMGCGDVWMLADAAIERIAEADRGVISRSRSGSSARACGDRVRAAFPLASLTTFRMGGPAALFLEPDADEDLAAAGDAIREAAIPWLVLGKGSNVLVADDGFPGLVLRLGRGFRWAAREAERLSAGGAMPLPALAGVALRHALAWRRVRRRDPGLGRRRGPDERRGPRRRDGATSSRRIDVFRLDARPSRGRRRPDAGFAYRSSGLPRDAVVIGATLRLAPDDAEAIRGADGRGSRVAPPDPAGRRAELRQRLHEPARRARRQADRRGGRQGRCPKGAPTSPRSTRTSSSPSPARPRSRW